MLRSCPKRAWLNDRPEWRLRGCLEVVPVSGCRSACSTARRPGTRPLDEKVGDAVSFRILRDWAAQYRYGNVTTAQFIALAERDSGRNLQYFFDVWFVGAGRPPTDDQNEVINPGTRHGALVDRHERSEIPPPI